jgi:hypothetical protein
MLRRTNIMLVIATIVVLVDLGHARGCSRTKGSSPEGAG